jgi:hypothetical protein
VPIKKLLNVLKERERIPSYVQRDIPQDNKEKTKA